jgi:hypothetical protein
MYFDECGMGTHLVIVTPPRLDFALGIVDATGTAGVKFEAQHSLNAVGIR